MKRIRIVGLCLVAVFAFTAVAAASASAAPEYKVCVKAAKEGKTYTGHYTSKECNAKVESGGKYELESAFNAEGKFNGKKPAFKTSTKSKSTLYSYDPGVGVLGTVECAKAKGEGSITGNSTSESVVTFEKCESSGFKCTSTGETKAGNIKTNPLKGTLVNLAEGKVGQVLEAVSGEASAEAEFDCEGQLHVITVGSLVGEETGNVEAISKKATLAFSVNAGGEQVPGEAEGTAHSLVSEIEEAAFTGSLPSGEATTDAIKGEALGIYG